MMDKIKKYLRYAGIEKEQYEYIFPEILERNLRNLRIYSLGMSIYFVAFFIYAIIVSVFDPLYYLYIADSIVMPIFCVVTNILIKKKQRKPWVSVFMNYWFMSMIYIDALIITCYFSDRQSTAFLVRLVILPAVCLDTPLRMIIFQGLAVLAFYIVTPFYNIERVVQMDRSEIVSYIIISIIICIFVTSMHVKEILHEKGNEYLSNYDVLTGVKNRNSFEHEHMPLPNEKQPPNYYIYADVNGLHEMNNKYGHEAGDAMLKTVAAGLKEIFGAENSYRIGGDEFVSYTDLLSKEQIEAELKRLGEFLAEKNFFVSFGMAGSDEDFDTKQEIIKAAEQRMYAAKKQFYQNKGEEFGGRKRG